jgi:hypothetical protein
LSSQSRRAARQAADAIGADSADADSGRSNQNCQGFAAAVYWDECPALSSQNHLEAVSDCCLVRSRFVRLLCFRSKKEIFDCFADAKKAESLR